MFWVWCVCFFTGNMNLVLLLSGLLLGNSTTRVDLHTEPEVIDLETSAEVTIQEQWEQYKAEFSKTYDSRDEELRRLEIFIENSKIIDEHNDLFSKGFYTYQLGHNQFSDLTHEEYLEKYTSGPEENPSVTNFFERKDEEAEYDNLDEKSDDEATIEYEGDITEYDAIDENNEFVFIPPKTSSIPFAIDWRAHGAVTPVKNEQHCGASWAFSAVGALESQLFQKTRHLVSLSEQNLLDCTTKYGNKGCKNGTAANAYRYIIANGGIDNNVTYPWKGKKSWFCHYRKLSYNPTVHGIVHLRSGNETALQSAVAIVGPVAVAIDGTSNKFKFYKNGIFNQPSCSSRILNREALVVGYGREFWIVKNSWGGKWGLNGYIYMTKNGRNQCGIATRPVYPIV